MVRFMETVMNKTENKRLQTPEYIKAKKAKKKSRIIELICIWSILILPLINLLVFWVYGTLQSIPIAFEHKNVADGTITYDFYNFEFLFKNLADPSNKLIEALTNSLTYWSVNFFILTPISFLIGYFLFKKIWGYKLYRYIFFFPQIISSVILSTFFWYFTGTNGITKVLGLDVMLLRNSDTAMGTMIAYNVYFGLCGNLLYWLSAFARIPDEIFEAAKIDGCNVFQEFIYVAFPCTFSFLATMMMLMVTGILSTGGATLLLTEGGYGTYDLPYYEYALTVSKAMDSSMAQGVSGCLGLVKGIVILPIALIINRLITKIDNVEF